MHIAIFRSDNLGDLIVTLPLVRALKSLSDKTKITLIAREYVRALAESSELIDIFFPLEAIDTVNNETLVEIFKEKNFDSLIMLSQNARLQKIGKKAKVPHLIYRLKNNFYFGIHRSLLKSRLINVNFYDENGYPIHFAQRLIKFCRFYGRTITIPRSDLWLATQLAIRPSSYVDSLLSSSGKKIVLHPGTNGHTDEWPASNFYLVTERLPADVTIFVTGSAEEGGRLNSYFPQSKNIINLFGKLSLSQLIYFLSRVDCLVANATGPLHLAAALGTKVVGLYPARTTVSPIRWGPIGKNVTTLTAPHCKLSLKNKKCNCIERISVESVITEILCNLGLSVEPIDSEKVNNF